jgi:hypothetical protein
MKSLESIATPEVDAAIARVLAAEQAARRAVEQCEAEAGLRVQAAQARAHGIAERAARRVARVHRWIDTTIATRTAAINAERAALSSADLARPDEERRLAEVLRQLADELVWPE